MNNEEKDNRKKTRRSRLSRQLLMWYSLSLIGFAVALVILVFLAWRISSAITWYDTNPIYWILKFAKEYILLFIGAFALMGWTIITYYFMSKPLRYLDEVVEAAEQMTKSPEKPVVLPPAMLETQSEMNLIRESALRDAHAAKEAEQRKNDLIVYLAHDLKTPLTSVIGYLTLLRDEPQISQELRAKYTAIALEKAERLENLINEFFDITRFNLSSLTMESESINLTRMLEQLTYEFNPVLTEKNLTWEIQLAPNVQILCDPDKLERVFDNLFCNAVNYSYPDTVIALTLTQTDTDAVIKVKNHGKTIAPEKLSRIFEQFFRVDSSRASSTGGAGLGLAIAREIVEFHGGSISAESENESILFTVTLPCKKIV